MNYYIKTRTGQILKGKATSWKQVYQCMPFGAKLFNPHTGRTVFGWNKYKAEMARYQRRR